MIKKNHKPSVGVFTPPLVSGGITPLSNLIDVIYPNSTDLYLVTGKAGYDRFKDDKRIRLYEFRTSEPVHLASHFAVTALKFIYTQMKASYEVAKLGKNVDSWIFFLGADYFPLAVLAAKILGREALIVLSGNFLHPSVVENDFPKIMSLLYKASRRLSDHIILYSDLIEEWDLEPYRKKIIIAHRHFLNFSEFKFKDNLEQRDNVIGFVGRLESQKGILNFVEAMPKTLAKRKDTEFLIIGEGKLEDEVRALLDEYSIDSKVKRFGWIPHDELPEWLTSLKLLVLPSNHEGLPNIMLEAMACGTPVLATRVDAIPDVIKDEETGFFLRDNSPACIAEGIVATLSYPNLRQIAINARNLVESEFRYENVVKIWVAILCNTKKS
jgi:glycosyltransferase involved in cell wall biosynthesis